MEMMEEINETILGHCNCVLSSCSNVGSEKGVLECDTGGKDYTSQI